MSQETDSGPGLLKIAAIVLNAVLLGVIAFLTFENGLPRNDGLGLVFFLLVLATPIINLLHVAKPSHSENWFTLFLERKKLEEKAKLKRLKDEENGHN